MQLTSTRSVGTSGLETLAEEIREILDRTNQLAKGFERERQNVISLREDVLALQARVRELHLDCVS